MQSQGESFFVDILQKTGGNRRGQTFCCDKLFLVVNYPLGTNIYMLSPYFVLDKGVIGLYLFLLGIVVLFLARKKFLGYFLVIMIASAVSEVIKNAIHLPRPVIEGSLMNFEGARFPSTHTTIAFAVAFFLLHVLTYKKGRVGDVYLRKFIVFVSFLIAGTIAVTRILIGAHYPVDILAGILLGFLVSLPFRYCDLRLKRI